MYANAEQTLKVRTNKRVRQALARRDIFVEEFDFLTGELSATEQGYALYLPKCGLNVFILVPEFSRDLRWLPQWMRRTKP